MWVLAVVTTSIIVSVASTQFTSELCKSLVETEEYQRTHAHARRSEVIPNIAHALSSRGGHKDRPQMVDPSEMPFSFSQCGKGFTHSLLARKESKRHCEEHEEELKLFCETDKTLICVICAAVQEHREHRFKPIKEAVKIYKDQLKSSLDSLTKKKSYFQKKEQQQKEKISGVRKQSPSIQTYITSQFAELRQIITEKEQSLLRDLKEEEKRILDKMEKNLLALQENIRIIQEEITKLKEQMDQKDGVIFLKEEAHWNRRINDDVQELSVTDEALPVEKFDHLYLLNTVLRETLDAINRECAKDLSRDSTLPVLCLVATAF
ncbi:E3 ubiquitin-protein ligase TRIM62-like [Hemitrygon akajei]|uniref:E3 ubiquitin-protein ligase TRIM62-like n=1 Tax=Hemitrygon akajei TaxID=2704970 RepID=UPI003BFA3472